jgi:hypothetical protein
MFLVLKSNKKAKRAPLSFVQPDVKVRSFIPGVSMYKVEENEVKGVKVIVVDQFLRIL